MATETGTGKSMYEIEKIYEYKYCWHSITFRVIDKYKAFYQQSISCSIKRNIWRSAALV